MAAWWERASTCPITLASTSVSAAATVGLTLALLFLTPASLAADIGGGGHDESLSTAEGDEANNHEEEDETEQPIAVLFPWFTEAVGVFVFLILTRKLHALPYTAVMFLVGTFMGVGADRSGLEDQLSESIRIWTWINGEVVLLVFLPGLLFWDALDVNFHLFQVSFWQLLIMAFPMVLAGTTLTALVGFYVFPYGWSFMLSMTFGSILAATDPVAVSALLNEVGAPPRLKMHVSGESLLNDGSAVVFYTIFSLSWLHELDIGLGQVFTVGEGFALFFRMSLGGAAIGFGFGLGLLLLLFYLDRRLEKEENVIQVATTITVAYLSFYTAEVTCHTSGVIAVVSCGITTKAFGSGMINDHHLLESFWILVEHLLNTLLFTLGGVVWGETISNQEEPKFLASDWGYLFLLYVLVQAIRFFLVFAFYPLISRIGLKSNWQESVFLSFGGLRGAVGIALALSLDREVNAHSTYLPDITYTSNLFGMVGGIALLTLVINGMLAGPLLRKLGLAKSSSARARIEGRFQKKIKHYIIDRFLHLLTDPRFCEVEFAVVQHHVPPLEGLTVEELNDAVRKNCDSVPAHEYRRPYLRRVVPYLVDYDASRHEENALSIVLESDENTDSLASDEDGPTPTAEPKTSSLTRSTAFNFKLAQELRLTFLELVSAAYQIMVEKGELDPQETGGFMAYTLHQSLDFAADAVSRGLPLCDWEASQVVSSGWTDSVKGYMHQAFTLQCARKQDIDKRSHTPAYIRLRSDVLRALAFINAHRTAQERFLADFCDEGSEDFKVAAELVRQESEAQVLKAEDLLHSFDQNDVKVIVSHFFCVILLNKTARYIGSLTDSGLLKPREAHVYIEQIEEALHHIHHCSLQKHPGELDQRETLKERRKTFSQLLLCRLRAESVGALGVDKEYSA